MKSTENFKKVISDKLNLMADADPLFAVSLKKEGKNIDDCITYILNTVQKSGCVGFTDEEIFGMAAHYYDEEKIEIGKPINAKVVVNHSVDLTPDDIQTAKQMAMERVISEEKEKLLKKAQAKKQDPSVVNQGSLF